MNGGPSQVDTFDPKPLLDKHAGQPLPADKKFINSGGRKMGFLTPSFRPFRPGGKSGLPVSDFFPHVRKHADKLAVIRSCHTDSHAHGSALVAMNTGKTFIGRPSLGSWSLYGLGTANQDLPGYVVMLDKRGGPISGQPNYASGFLSSAYAGTLFRPSGNPVLDLTGPVSREVQRQQLALLEQLNHQHMARHPGGNELAARMASYELAYRMQAAVPEAVDLAREPSKLVEAYGIGRAGCPFHSALFGRRAPRGNVGRSRQYREKPWPTRGGSRSTHRSSFGRLGKPWPARRNLSCMGRGIWAHAFQ
jgi:hypothetical protein